ncbi:MarR family winged helix-turn-helix transcriptional regulator [Candidatus Hydrogenedentota bacterium]
MTKLGAEKIERQVDLWIRLIPRIAKGINSITGEATSALDVTITQITAILALFESKTMTMGELREEVGVSLSSATGIVDGLVKKGLTRRLQDDKDRRVVKVVLTTKGVELAKTAVDIQRRQVELILSAIDEEDMVKIGEVFEKIVGKIGYE